MDLLEVVRQVGKRPAGLLGAKASDLPVTLLRPKSAQQFNAAARVHTNPLPPQLHAVRYRL